MFRRRLLVLLVSFFFLFCFEALFAVVKFIRKKQICVTCLADREGFGFCPASQRCVEANVIQSTSVHSSEKVKVSGQSLQ